MHRINPSQGDFDLIQKIADLECHVKALAKVYPLVQVSLVSPDAIVGWEVEYKLEDGGSHIVRTFIPGRVSSEFVRRYSGCVYPRPTDNFGYRLLVARRSFPHLLPTPVKNI